MFNVFVYTYVYIGKNFPKKPGFFKTKVDFEKITLTFLLILQQIRHIRLFFIKTPLF